MHEITRIAITGGPCAGKTTVMAYERQKLEELGYTVLVVPESASLCINGGIDPRNPRMTPRIVQQRIIETVKFNEDGWLQTAKDIAKNVEALGRHLKAYEDYYKKMGNSLSTTVNHFNAGSKELGKIDKDILRITESSPGLDSPLLDKPTLDFER